MRCDGARAALSARLDGEPAPDGLEEHLATCDACSTYADDLGVLRRRMRYQVVDAEIPDLAPAILTAVRTGPQETRVRARNLRSREVRPRQGPPRDAGNSRRREKAGGEHADRGGRRRTLGAVFVAAFVAGAAFVGVNPQAPPQVAAAEIPGRVVAAQTALHSLTATVEVTERGWHPAVPERTYSGTLAYSAPESLTLDLVDTSAYPDASWVPNHVTAVTAGEHAWTRGPAPCPREVQPECTPSEPRVLGVEGREAFGPAAPAPLDLILPVRSFSGAAAPESLRSLMVSGRAAVGVATTAAQVGPLLDGLRQAGNWRELYPGDRVELWLDAQTLVPLRFAVVPAGNGERELWAARRGYRDPPGTPVLEFALGDVVQGGKVGADAFPPVPSNAEVRDAGFGDSSAVDAPTPAWLPDGMMPHRHGEVGHVLVQTWTDGRAWLKVRSTTSWEGGRLFGSLGDVVRPIDLGLSTRPAHARAWLTNGGAGVAYVGEDGHAVALHGDTRDAVVTGSVGTDALLRVAASLGIDGEPVPAGWREAAAASLEELAAIDPDALVAPSLEGFGPPAVRPGEDALTLVYAGAGDRGFLLAQAPGETLTPPLDPDARGVQVRGVAGRYSPVPGELEWVENGRIVSVRTTTLTLEELVAVAERLVPAGQAR